MTPNANGQVGTKGNGAGRKAAPAPATDLAGLHDRGSSPKTQADDRALAAGITLHVQELIDTMKVDRPLVGLDIRTVADAFEHLANILRVRASEWPAP